MTALAQDVRTLCEDDSYLFHAPDEREAPAAKAARETAAKNICARCPLAIKESCLNLAMEAEHGLTAQHRNGIYGGLTEQERADLDDTNDDNGGARKVRCEPCGRDFANAGAYQAHETWMHKGTNDTAERIRELAAAGNNDRQIGERLRMNQKTVFAIRSRHNIPAAMPVPPKKEAS